jgi:hypothetical protein
MNITRSFILVLVLFLIVLLIGLISFVLLLRVSLYGVLFLLGVL